MKKLFRILTIILLLLLLLVTAAGIAIRHWLSPERLRPRLESLTLLALHRQAAIENPRLSLWRLRIDRIQLAKGPTFGAGTEVTLEGIRLTWQWRQVLKAARSSQVKPGPWDGLLKIDRLTHQAYEARGVLV